MANELADVKEQLILANASLDAKEIELIKAQATAGQNAGFIAEQLQGELHSLQSTSSHQVKPEMQCLRKLLTWLLKTVSLGTDSQYPFIPCTD